MTTNHDTISKFIAIHRTIIESKRVNTKHSMNINRSLKDPTDAIWLRVNDIINKYGLKFIKGTFLVNINNLDKYLTRYNRAIRLRHLSHKWPKKDSDPTYWVKNPTYNIAAAEESASKYDNPINNPAALISFLESSKESILTLARTHNYPNLQFDGRYPDLEWALSLIINSRDKTLQACDKNLGGEIVDRTFHNTVCLEELTATDDYTELHIKETDRLNILHDFQRKILSLTSSNFTDNKHPIYTYLLQCQITTAAFSYTYPLYKIHKEGPLKIRLICATNEKHMLYHCAKFIHLQLYPTLELMCPFLVKNSKQAITTLDSLIFPPSMILVASDVVRMYPTIIIEDAINSLIAYLALYESKTNKKITFKHLIINITALVLNNNYLYFSTLPTPEHPQSICRFFHQIKGLPIGSSCTPTIANIFMCMIELKAIRSAIDNHISPPLFYLRILDDIIAGYTSTDHSTSYCTLLKHASLEYTYESDPNSNIFMDIILYKGHDFALTGKLSTCIFQKLTNKFTYMRPDSMLPEHIIRNFIISELNRIRLFCSNDEDYAHFVCVFYHRLRHRTYSVKFLDDIFTAHLLQPLDPNYYTVSPKNVFLTLPSWYYPISLSLFRIRLKSTQYLHPLPMLLLNTPSLLLTLLKSIFHLNSNPNSPLYRKLPPYNPTINLCIHIRHNSPLSLQTTPDTASV